MRRSHFIIAASIVTGLTVFGCATTGGGSWVTLIDGEKGLENFNRFGDANWRAEGGAIVADKAKGGYLVSKESYANFEIRAEFWAGHDANSGIFMRRADRNNITDVKDTHVRLVLNGVETATGYDSQLANGPVALQFGNRGKEPGGVIKWRKVEIRPL